jgi:hypothetical protein
MTEQPPPLASLAKALAAFQSEMPKVGKAQKATVPLKAGGSYSYKYAGLPDVVDAVVPLLTKHGLSFTCCPRRAADGTYELAGILLHTSGESLTGSLPIFGRQAQEIGSAITYGRRYLLGCMTGVVTDEDEDGSLANQAQQRSQQTNDDKPLATKTRGALFALMGEFDVLASEDNQRAFLAHTLGRTVESRASLTEAEGRRAGRRLRAWKDGIAEAVWSPPEAPETADPSDPNDPWAHVQAPNDAGADA